jgi:hypothetical protein
MQPLAKENSNTIPKFPPAFAASIGLETVVDGKHENTAIPVRNSLIESGAIYEVQRKLLMIILTTKRYKDSTRSVRSNTLLNWHPMTALKKRMQNDPQPSAFTFFTAFLASSALIFTPLMKKIVGILQVAKNWFSPAFTPRSGLLNPTKIAIKMPVMECSVKASFKRNFQFQKLDQPKPSIDLPIGRCCTSQKLMKLLRELPDPPRRPIDFG